MKWGMLSVHESEMVQNVKKIIVFHIHFEKSKTLVKCFAGQSHPGDM